MKKMISDAEALRIVLEQARPRLAADVPIDEALGSVLAADIVADRDYPPFDRAMMDGYAVRLADAGWRVPVVGEVAAGQHRSEPLADGGCLAIMTGAPCPSGTEAVVQKERVQVRADDVDLPTPIEAGDNITTRGCECRAGAVVAASGAEVTPLVVAVASSVGRRTLRALAPPSLAIVTTGNEVVSTPGEPPFGAIRNSNGPMLEAMAQQLGVRDIQRAHALDDDESLAAALAQTAKADVVVLCGGVSAGKYDLVPGAVERAGACIRFHKVRQKPGKPMLFATKGAQLIFGLPGTPLGTHLGFFRYVSSAIRRLGGHAVEIGHPLQQGTLRAPIQVRGQRAKHLLAAVRWDGTEWGLAPVTGRSSSDFFSPSAANAYVRVPAGSHTLDVGTAVPFEWTAPADGRFRRRVDQEDSE